MGYRGGGEPLDKDNPPRGGSGIPPKIYTGREERPAAARPPCESGVPLKYPMGARPLPRPVMASVPPPRPVTRHEIAEAVLRNGGSWEEAIEIMQPHRDGQIYLYTTFRKAYAEGRLERQRRHAMEEAERELESYLQGEPFNYRPFEDDDGGS